MVGSSTWRLNNENAARNLQLTTLSYTPKGFEGPSFNPNADIVDMGRILKDCNKNDFIPNPKQPDVACITSTLSQGQDGSRNSALVVRDGVKHYGSGKSCSTVLKNFNMTVPKGTM